MRSPPQTKTPGSFCYPILLLNPQRRNPRWMGRLVLCFSTHSRRNPVIASCDRDGETLGARSLILTLIGCAIARQLIFEHYTWDKIAAKLSATYQGILANQTPQ